MEHPSIAGIQKAAQDAATATVREKEAATKPSTPKSDNQDNPPPEGKPLPPKETAAPAAPATPATPPAQPPAFNLKEHIKETYGMDLDDEEILKRLQSNGQQAPVVKKRELPKKEDITDDQVQKFLADNKKADLFQRHADNQKKEDIALVREHQYGLIKTQFPNLKEEEVNDLINERYFIHAGDDENPYTEEEKKLGEYMLQQEAKRLRDATAFQVDGVRNMLHQQALTDYTNYEFSETVASFIKTQPKQMVLPFGKSGAIDLGDYPVTLKDETIQEVGAIMADPVKLLDKFKNKPDDANYDLQKMYDFLLKGILFDTVAKSTASDYYSKGVEFMEGKLHNNPDLTQVRPPKERNSQKDELKQAEDFNQKQVADNIGRGRKR